MNTDNLILTSVLGLAVNLVGMFVFGEHGHSHGGESCHGHGNQNMEVSKLKFDFVIFICFRESFFTSSQTH